MRWLYAFVMWLAQPLLKRKLRRRGVKEPGYLQAIDERFGHYASPLAPHAGPTVWIHAVSLGETRAAAVLVTTLRQQLPGMRLLLTHGTATGRAEGLKLLQAGDLQAWQPWDTVGACQSFLAHFQPCIGVLMETEIWPNLVHCCQQGAVPLVLANARLSAKSLRQAQRLAWLARPAYAGLTAVWAQTPQDAERLKQLGAPVRAVLGNLKFDATPDARQIATGRDWRLAAGKPVLMLASSREGEELALLQLLQEEHATVGRGGSNALVDAADAAGSTAGSATSTGALSAAQWLIVPRHPQRFEAVAELIRAQGFAVSRRSSWGDAGPAAAPGGPAAVNRIWLGDSLGEMALYFGLADVALLGGSFEPLGGQNLIEAAACGCPVVMGPHTFNFAEAAEQAQAAGAALRVPDLKRALRVAREQVADPAGLLIKRQSCITFAQAHRGATLRLAQAITELLKEPLRPARS